MKKKLIVAMLGVVGFMLVACSSQNDSQENIQESVQESVQENSQENSMDELQPEDEIYEGMTSVINPWVDSDKEGVLDATGFDMVAPKGAVNVIYNYMSDAGMAQMNFNLNNAMWIYRMQSTDDLEDISGIYCDWIIEEETTVAGMKAMEYVYVGEQEGDFIDDVESTRVLNWYDADKKVTNSISIVGTGLDGLDTIVYVENNFIK